MRRPLFLITALTLTFGAFGMTACNPFSPDRQQKPGQVPQPRAEAEQANVRTEHRNQVETGRDQAGQPQNHWGSEQLRFDTAAGRNHDPRVAASPYPSQQNRDEQ